MACAKIVVADQDAAVLGLIALHLRNEDYDVICTTDAEEALEMARCERPDLLLLDVNLSAGGSAIHDHLAEYPDVARVPTLYLVDRRAPASTAERRKPTLPASVSIEKPVVISELLAKVSEAVGQSEQRDVPPQPRQRVA